MAPNAKRPRSPASAPAEGSAQPRPTLRHSDTPGVYLNAFNVPCDARGIALSFLEVKQRDAARWSEALGEEADSPAKLLKGAALDPRLPMATRLDAAKAAAPYFDRKMPLALEGSAPGEPIKFLDVTKMKGLSDAELKQMRALLLKAGTRHE